MGTGSCQKNAKVRERTLPAQKVALGVMTTSKLMRSRNDINTSPETCSQGTGRPSWVFTFFFQSGFRQSCTYV